MSVNLVVVKMESNFILNKIYKVTGSLCIFVDLLYQMGINLTACSDVLVGLNLSIEALNLLQGLKPPYESCHSLSIVCEKNLSL